MRSRWPLVVGLVVIGLLVWLWQSASEPAEPARRVEATPAGPQVPLRTGQPRPTKPRIYSPPKANPFDATSHHTADPCTALSDPMIPAGYEQVTEGAITIAWDPSELTAAYDAPLRPVSLAHLSLGILEEAAQLTGTDRRRDLTIIVDASSDDMQLRTKTPSWVNGLYDGSAVVLYAKPGADVGVVMHTLRHEIMHAQIHASVGCVPFWFNEGLAVYFSGNTPMREWFSMLRTGEPYDLTTLREPFIFDLRVDNVQRMYAVATAMTVYLVHRGGETAIKEAVRMAQGSSREDALELWTNVAPNVDYRMLLESLAQKTFGIPLGPELDAILRGTTCCKNLRSVGELSCRAAAQGEYGLQKPYYCRRT